MLIPNLEGIESYYQLPDPPQESTIGVDFGWLGLSNWCKLLVSSLEIIWGIGLWKLGGITWTLEVSLSKVSSKRTSTLLDDWDFLILIGEPVDTLVTVKELFDKTLSNNSLDSGRVEETGLGVLEFWVSIREFLTAVQ